MPTSLPPAPVPVTTGAAYVQALRHSLGDTAVMVLPVRPRRGPMLNWSATELLDFPTACFRLTAPSSLAGVPQVVVPCRREDGSYVPLSLLGPRDADFTLLRIAEQLTDGTDAVRLG